MVRMSPRWYQVRARSEGYARYIWYIIMLTLNEPFPPNYFAESCTLALNHGMIGVKQIVVLYSVFA